MDVYEDRWFRTNFLVGLLTIAIVAGLATVVTFFLGKERPFAATCRIGARFSDVAGLKIGAPVTLQGATIGRVESLGIDRGADGTSWLVRLAIRDEPWIRRSLTTQSDFTLQAESVFGNKFVNATFGDGGAPLADGAAVEGVVGAGIDARTFQKLSSALDDLSQASRTLKNALSEENQTQLKQTFDDISKTSANLADVTERMKSSMDSWAETMEKMRFWRGWFGNDEKEKKARAQ